MESHLTSWLSVSCGHKTIQKCPPHCFFDVVSSFAHDRPSQMSHIWMPSHVWLKVFLFFFPSCYTFASLFLQPAFDSLAAAFLIAATLSPLALFLWCWKCRLFKIPGHTQSSNRYSVSPVICTATWSTLNTRLVLKSLFALRVCYIFISLTLQFVSRLTSTCSLYKVGVLFAGITSSAGGWKSHQGHQRLTAAADSTCFSKHWHSHASSALLPLFSQLGFGPVQIFLGFLQMLNQAHVLWLAPL